jgi:flagellar hook-associated protein 1 FlgK
MSIGLSGAKAARSALDITSQNIANASTEGYVRRSIGFAEVGATGYNQNPRDISLSGVRVDRVMRNVDAFRQAEVRRTGADTARAEAEVIGLQNAESALERSNVYPAIVGFESSLQKLKEDTTDTALRASVIESARTMTATFQIAAQELDAVGNGLRFEATDGVNQVTLLAAELGRTNLRLARAADASSDQTLLLDQRDRFLSNLSEFGNLDTTFASDGTVEVRLGGPTGPALVTGGTSGTMTMATAANGTVTFALNGTPTTLTGGSLAGRALALNKLTQLHTDLDSLARDIVTTVNSAQAGGVALDGSAGQNLLSGTSAATFALVTNDGKKIATAPAGAPAKSRDAANLTALQAALATTNPAKRMDGILFDVSATVAGRTVTRDALKTISDSARITLSSQSAVNLDTEAANLLRFQQAFQASSRVMQIASTLFDTLLQIR